MSVGKEIGSILPHVRNSLTICICIRLKYGASAASVFFQIATSGINVHIVEITHLHVKAN